MGASVRGSPAGEEAPARDIPPCGTPALGGPVRGGPVRESASRGRPARESAVWTHVRALLPVVPVRARGLTVEGADGRRYLDCVSGAGALALGHNHPVVLEAVRKVPDPGAPPRVPDLATSLEDAFVTELFPTLPPGLAGRARVRFCGPARSDAVAAALELVRAATGRTGVLAFTGAHHATTAGSLQAFGGDPAVRVTRLSLPRDHRCPSGAGDEAGAELAGRRVESVLDGPEPGAPPPAALILEPVQGEGGVSPVPDAWMRRVRRVTADRSIPLIADETRTGVGRTGAFWAVGHSGVTPDVMVLSKAVGGGLPLAVIVHRDDLDVREPGTRADAFRGNRLALAAGTAALAHVRAHGLAGRAAVLGERLLRRLRRLADDFPCVGDVHGRGLMIGVEMVDPEGNPRGHGAAARGTPCASPGLAAAVRRECLSRGLIVGLAGCRASVVRLLPPLTITDEQAAAVIDRFSDAVHAVARTRAKERP